MLGMIFVVFGAFLAYVSASFLIEALTITNALEKLEKGDLWARGSAMGCTPEKPDKAEMNALALPDEVPVMKPDVQWPSQSEMTDEALYNMEVTPALHCTAWPFTHHYPAYFPAD